MDTGAAGDKAQVAHLGNGANAININTVEDLGGGLRGGFSAQIRYNVTNGDVNSSGFGNALFHAANAYVGGGFGTVRIGKIAEASTCGLDPWACGGGAALQAGVGVNALTGALAVSNAVSYTTPTINGFSASYQTSLSARPGVTSSGTTVGRDNERETLNISYVNGPLTLQFLDIKGTGNAVGNRIAGQPIDILAAGTATSTTNAAYSIADVATSNQAIGGSYNFGVARLSLVNSVAKNAAGAKTADITSIGATVPMGAYTILAGYSKAKTGGSFTATAANDTKIAAGVNYALSKRTTLGADVFKAETATAVTGSGASGNAGTGFVVRVGHTF
jgi:hypothetical protein